jgi:hypothetical protein
MNLCIGVQQVTIEEPDESVLMVKTIGTGWWRPTIEELGDIRCHWVGRETYASQREALEHLMTDARQDERFPLRDLLEEQAEQIEAMVLAWVGTPPREICSGT